MSWRLFSAAEETDGFLRIDSDGSCPDTPRVYLSNSGLPRGNHNFLVTCWDAWNLRASIDSEFVWKWAPPFRLTVDHHFLHENCHKLIAYHHFFSEPKRATNLGVVACRGHGDGEIGGLPTALLGGSAAVGESAVAVPAGGWRRRHAERGERFGRGKTETGLGPKTAGKCWNNKGYTLYIYR